MTEGGPDQRLENPRRLVYILSMSFHNAHLSPAREPRSAGSGRACLLRDLLSLRLLRASA